MSVVIFADADDPDTQFVDAEFCRENGVIYIRWGMSTGDCDLLTEGKSWNLRVGANTVTSADLEAADRIIFRRWRSSPPTPALSATDTAVAKFAPFVERQWDSAVLGLLYLSYRQRPEVWSRDPLRVDNKAATLAVLSEIVPVPPYIISNHVPTADVALVSKAIDADQSVGENERVSTVRVEPQDGFQRQPCPSVLQTLVECRWEARVGYAFGRTAVTRQWKEDAAVVDIRAAAVNRAPWGTSRFDRDAHAIAQALGLEMFTADILVDHDDVAWWIDVNPDGLFSIYDHATAHMTELLITCFSSLVGSAPKG